MWTRESTTALEVEQAVEGSRSDVENLALQKFGNRIPEPGDPRYQARTTSRLVLTINHVLPR